MAFYVDGQSRFIVKTEADLTDKEAGILAERLTDWMFGRSEGPLVLGHGAHAYERLPGGAGWRHVCCLDAAQP